MKKYFLLIATIIISNCINAQVDSIASPSARFRIFPPAKLLLADSTTFFTKEDLLKNKPILLMVFNPDCDHCQHETEDLISNIDKFKNIQIVMAAMAKHTEMKIFIEKYGLSKYNNITVGQDVSFFLPPFFNIKNLPFLAFYNKKQNLISTFAGSMTMEKILAELKK